MGYDIFIAAADGAGTLDWSTVSGVFTHVWDLLTSCTQFIVSNNIFLVLFAAGVIPVGFKLFKKIKKSVK